MGFLMGLFNRSSDGRKVVNIDEILDLHQKFLNGDEDGVAANFSNTNLAGKDFT